MVDTTFKPIVALTAAINDLKLFGDFKPIVTLTKAMTDLKLFGETFGDASFWPWKVIGKVIDGIPLTEPRELELFEQCTGRPYNRQARREVRRLFILAGRRAGKDRFESAVGVWRAALCADWRKYLSAGEQAIVILIGRDLRQAKILRNYCEGLIAKSPVLQGQVVRATNEVIEFKNGGCLEIVANSEASVRGRSAVAVLGSECCYWKTSEHAASSDEEVVVGAEASMGMAPDSGLLILASSVAYKRGYMYRQYKELFGNESAVDLVWFAPSRTMNPKLPQHVIDEAMAKNPSKFGAEFLNHWREDQTSYPRDEVDVCTDIEVRERQPQSTLIYSAWFDGATGGGQNPMALAITHRDFGSEIITLDLIREAKPRFNAFEVIAEWAKLLKAYHVYEIFGDAFAHQLFADAWRKHGIVCRKAETTTSENYRLGESLVLSHRVRFINNATLRSQLLSLERRMVGDHEEISPPRIVGAHDDVATAVMGAIVIAAKKPSFSYAPFASDYRDLDEPPQPVNQPEPPQCNGNWWKSMPRSQPTFPRTNDCAVSIGRSMSLSSQDLSDETNNCRIWSKDNETKIQRELRRRLVARRSKTARTNVRNGQYAARCVHAPPARP